MIYHFCMNVAHHLTGTSGAAVGLTIPLLAALIAIPPLVCRGVQCEQGIWGSTAFGTDGMTGVASMPINLVWSPYIDNPPEAGTGTAATIGPDCGSSVVRSPMLRLEWAPLPRNFDPAGYSGQQLFACVLISDDGSVIEAKLPESTGKRMLDRTLVRMIEKKWRFEPQRSGTSLRGWQRVRVNEGPKLEQPLVY